MEILHCEQIESSPSRHQGEGYQDLHCYIRRKNAPWVQARKHHETALQTYLSLHVLSLEPGETPTGAFIYADHEDGGQFCAYFTYINNNVYQFLDRYENTVQIIMETPARIAYANRITDC